MKLKNIQLEPTGFRFMVHGVQYGVMLTRTLFELGFAHVRKMSTMESIGSKVVYPVNRVDPKAVTDAEVVCFARRAWTWLNRDDDNVLDMTGFPDPADREASLKELHSGKDAVGGVWPSPVVTEVEEVF